MFLFGEVAPTGIYKCFDCNYKFYHKVIDHLVELPVCPEVQKTHAFNQWISLNEVRVPEDRPTARLKNIMK